MQFVCAVLKLVKKLQTNKTWYKTLEPKQENNEIGQYFTFEESKLEFGKQFLDKVLYEVMFVHILAEIFKGSHFEFFVEKVVRGNSVQIAPNFPAKSLSIYLNEFFLTPL